MVSSPRRVGVIAGRGALAGEVVRTLQRRGIQVHVITIDGEGAGSFGDVPVTNVNWGGIGRILATLRDARCADVLIIGGVDRPDLRRVRPDLGLFLNIRSVVRILRSGGDDELLREVVRFFERKGFAVAGPADVAPELVLAAGPVSRVVALGGDEEDISAGLTVIARLGPLDIGQAVVVTGGVIEAIEGAEGTDVMLDRVAARRAAAGLAAGIKRGVLIKAPKPGQELRVDMPVIGPDTVTRAAAAGLSGIAISAGRVLTAERAELLARADASGIFVMGVQVPVETSLRADYRNSSGGGGVRHVLQSHRRDAGKSVAVVSALQALMAQPAAVTAGGRVLAVSGSEKPAELIRRLGAWRTMKGYKRKYYGVAAIGGMRREDEAAVLDAAVQASLAGVVIIYEGAAADRSGAKALTAVTPRELFVIRIARDAAS